MRLKSPGTENTSVHPISTSLRARCLPKHAVDLMIGYTAGAGLAAFDLAAAAAATAVVVDLRTIVADEPLAAAGFGFPVESKDEAAAASGFGFCIDSGVDEAAAASSAAGFGFILDDEAGGGCGFSIEPEAEAAAGVDADDEADVGRGFSIEPDDEADVGRGFSVEPDDEGAAACGFAVAAAACEFGIEAGSEVMIVMLLAGELGLLASRRRTETSLLNLGERVVLRSAALTNRLPLCDVGLCAVFAYKLSSRLMRIVFFFSHTPTPAMPHASAKFSSQQTTQQQRRKLRFLFSPTTLQPTLQSAAVFSTAAFIILSRLSQLLLKSYGADQVAALHSCV